MFSNESVDNGGARSVFTRVLNLLLVGESGRNPVGKSVGCRKSSDAPAKRRKESPALLSSMAVPWMRHFPRQEEGEVGCAI